DNMEHLFLGTGWNFPPAFDGQTGTVIMAEGEEDIQQSLEILLSTRQGERVMQPEYGCNLDDLLFEPVTTTLKTFISEKIKTAILYFDPRIELISITLDDSKEPEGIIQILIEYKVRATNSRFNFVYPYYKNEGTELK